MNTEVTNMMPATEEVKTPALTLVPKEEMDEPKSKKKSVKTRAPKARPVEELVEAPTKNMTDKEKDNLIEYFKEQIIIADNKIEQYKQNSEAAFKRARNVEDEFKAMEAYYKDRLAYLTNSTRIFYQSVCLATKGDVK